LTGICGCCDAVGTVVLSTGSTEFRCGCMHKLLCRVCNHCKVHCICAPEVQDLDIPYPDQVAIAKHEWRVLGVAI